MKKFLCILIILFISLTVNANENLEVEEYKKQIYVDGKTLLLNDNSPILRYNDVTYSCVSAFAEAFGYSATFDELCGIYYISKNNYTGKIKFGKQENSKEITLNELIVNPKENINKRVSINGYIRVGFEEDCLFLTYDDYKYYNSENSVLLNFRTKMSTLLNTTVGNVSTISGNYVKIQGVLKELNGYYLLDDINLIETLDDNCSINKYSAYIPYKAPKSYTAKTTKTKFYKDDIEYIPLNEHGEVVPVFVFENKTYLPLRTFAKVFNLDINYDEKTDLISFNKKENAEKSVYGEKCMEYNPVSLLNLADKPENFDGKHISASGFIEDNKLYLSSGCNSLYVELELFEGLKQFNNRYVFVCGTFKSQGKKHFINNIDYIYTKNNVEQFPFELYFDQWNDDI